MDRRASANYRLRLCFICLCVTSLALRLLAGEVPPNSAEDSWQKLLAAEGEWYQRQPTSLEGKDFDEFLAQGRQRAGELADQFKDYRARYANSLHEAEAWEKWMDLLNIAAQGTPARLAEVEKAEQQCLEDPKLDRCRRENIRNHQIERIADIKEQEKFARKVKDEFQSPTRFFCEYLLETAEFSDYPLAREIVEEILKMKLETRTPEWYREHVPAPATVEGWITVEKQALQECQQRARGLKERLDRIGHLVQLKFTALDGTAVDLEHLRGKVVLLEFWATWCAPCVAGIPQIQSAWRSLHKEGFEVIGLSYDTEREKLERFVKKNALPWPQFFAPEGKEAPLIKTFGQPGPPAYWLIDHQGILVDLNAHEKLEQKVKRLLAVPAGTKPKSGSDTAVCGPLFHEATNEFATMTTTIYQHQTQVERTAGSYRYDCVGFVSYALKQAAPQAWMTVAKVTGLAKGRIPSPPRYRAFLAGLAVEPQPGWEAVTKASELRPGDVVAWEHKTETSSGHAVVIGGTPTPLPDGSWLVEVYDSTSSPHSNDSRPTDQRAEVLAATGRHSGLGHGVMVFIADPTSGTLAGVRWGLKAKAITVLIAAGRPKS